MATLLMVSLSWLAYGHDAAQSGLFESGGFFIGCNYWAKHAGMYMWSDWHPEIIDRELAELAKYGVTVLRVFPGLPLSTAS